MLIVLRLNLSLRWRTRANSLNLAKLMSSHHPKLLQELEQERAERLAQRLTSTQIDAIVKDTRLPGEIAGAYGVTSEVILRILQRERKRENLVRAAHGARSVKVADTK